MSSKFLIGILFLLTINASDSLAQTGDTLALNSTVYVFQTSDGGKIIGTVLGADELAVIVKTNTLGNITIPRSTIVSITPINADTLTGQRFENPAFARNLVGPTAIPMKKGSSYLQSMYFVFNGYNYAFTDHFSLKIGTELTSVFLGPDLPSVFCISPRIGYRLRPNVHVGGGLLYSFTPRYSWMSHRITTSAYLTLGNKSNNLTIGIAWNFAFKRHQYWYGTTEWRFYRSLLPTASLGGMVRFNKWLGMVTENWMFENPVYSGNGSQYDIYYSLGFRGMGESFSVDAGAMSSTDWYFFSSRIWAIPYVGFSINFR